MKNIFRITLLAALVVPFAKVNAQEKTPSNKWKLGIAMWTFHRFPIDESITKIDSSGLHYMEGSVFQKGGSAIEQVNLMAMAPEGIEKLKTT
jgi:hypothetical protein